MGGAVPKDRWLHWEEVIETVKGLQIGPTWNLSSKGKHKIHGPAFYFCLPPGQAQEYRTLRFQRCHLLNSPCTPNSRWQECKCSLLEQWWSTGSNIHRESQDFKIERVSKNFAWQVRLFHTPHPQIHDETPPHATSSIKVQWAQLHICGETLTLSFTMLPLISTLPFRILTDDHLKTTMTPADGICLSLEYSSAGQGCLLDQQCWGPVLLRDLQGHRFLTVMLNQSRLNISITCSSQH